MKVLWFINTPFTGSQIGTHIAGGRGGWLSSLAAIIRHDVRLCIAFVDPYAPPVVKEGQITAFAIRPSAWNSRLIAKSVFNYRFLREFSVSQLKEIVDRSDPDIIHVHGTEKGYIELLDPLVGVTPPIMVSLQGVMRDVAQCYAGGYNRQFLESFWYDRGGRLASLLPKRLLADWRYTIAQAKRERAFLPFARYIDGRTGYDREVARAMSPDSLYFHIDLVLRSSFSKASWRCSGRLPALAISTMSDSLLKGFDLVALATKIICGSLPEFRWIIVGLSSSSICVSAARKRMGRSFPEEKFEFLGSLGPEGITSALLRASVFVLPSYIENSPNALAEAQMLGVPCIASDVGGVSSYVENDINGLLVPPGDATELANCVLDLLGQPARASRLGAAGRETASVRHDPARIRTQVLDAYTRVCVGNGSALESYEGLEDCEGHFSQH